MVSPEKFKSFYDIKLLPVLQDIETERKAIARQVKWFILFPPVIAGAAAYLINSQEPVFALVATILVFLLGLGAYYLVNRKKIHAFKLRFKMDVVKAMIKAIDENLDYNHNRCISESDYRKSKIFLSNHTSYRGDDLVWGTIGKTAIRFSEVHTIRKEKSGKEERRVTVFKGILFIADFNKNFKGETVVLPDIAENLLGNFLGGIVQKMSIGRDELVKLEDPEFEKAFVVHSSDQVEARYILSPALMRRLLDFKAKSLRRDIRISFVNSSVNIAVSISEDLFEARVLNSVINYDVLQSYHSYLAMFVGIVEDLNLNNRIWTKE